MSKRRIQSPSLAWYSCKTERSVSAVDTGRVIEKMRPGKLEEVGKAVLVPPHPPSHGKGLAPSHEEPWICLE